MTTYPFIPHPTWKEFPADEMRHRSADFFGAVNQRRTVREFSDRPVPAAVIENVLRAAGTAPSGANLQPWHFSVITNADIKKQIRAEAEVEERQFYEHRASPEWLAALEPLGTDSNKPFLETAPCLIAVFLQKFGILPDGRKVKHYYPVESTGLATGILITAIHMAGLVCLTHTPSPMKFLNRILDRPMSRRPFLLLVTGYPAKNVTVPDIKRKALNEFVTFHD